jgi:hypothetical protein
MLNHAVFHAERAAGLLSTIAFWRPAVKIDDMENLGPRCESAAVISSADDDRQMGQGPRSPGDAEPAILSDEHRVRQQQQQQQ